jgi:hypothetical protein
MRLAVYGLYLSSSSFILWMVYDIAARSISGVTRSDAVFVSFLAVILFFGFLFVRFCVEAALASSNTNTP